MWLWCPHDLLVFTPVPLQFILHTEARVILLKHKQVVPHLCSKPSEVWESRLPQNKTRVFAGCTLWPAPYRSDLLPSASGSVPACGSRLQAVSEVSCLWGPPWRPPAAASPGSCFAHPLASFGPRLTAVSLPFSPSHFLLPSSAFLFSLALFAL